MRVTQAIETTHTLKKEDQKPEIIVPECVDVVLALKVIGEDVIRR